MFKKIEETVCRMDGNRWIVVSKIYVHFTKTCQSSANLTQILKYTCEHIRFGEKKTRKLITVTGWKKISVQVDIIMTIFSKSYSVTKRKFQWKDVLNICSCIYTCWVLMKKTILTPLNAIFFIQWTFLDNEA
jgi:hypothetical protein